MAMERFDFGTFRKDFEYLALSHRKSASNNLDEVSSGLARMSTWCTLRSNVFPNSQSKFGLHKGIAMIGS